MSAAFPGASARLRHAAHPAPREPPEAPGRSSEAAPTRAPTRAPTGDGDADGAFSEEQIRAAFARIDLDGNKYVGAAELRHCLVCMGELVTDEEVDAMIGLVDDNGDGQVSLREFRELITDPDPARPGFRLRRQRRAGAGAAAAAGAAARERQQEHELRERKWSAILDFARAACLDAIRVRKAADALRSSGAAGAAGVDPQGEVSLEAFCRIFGVGRTAEAVGVFRLFARPRDEGRSAADGKAVVLGVASSVEMGTAARIGLIFDLYDGSGSGSLSEGQVRRVLRATHMQSEGMVESKLGTVMQHAGRQRGTAKAVNTRELAAVARRFPNLLFPCTKGGADT